MKNIIRYGLITTLLMLLPFMAALGQKWNLRSTSDFNYYYHLEDKELIDNLDSLFRLELFKLQKELNYFVNQPIDVFILESNSEALGLNHNLESDEETSGGIISLLPKKILVRVGLSYSELQYEFRQVATAILLEEMMFGINLQDRVRNANLIHLPEWVIPGLVYYIADDWSVETDNIWRMVYDEYGLKNFNTIPMRYDEVKGASFWKFIAYKYGDNAIPTMLYMTRLTRKFSAAFYYSFQVSIHEIFLEWKQFYDNAYSYDQKKPNPINGLNIDIASVFELFVPSQNLYYSLEKNGVGYGLYRTEITSNTRTKILNLQRDETPLAKFSGALFSYRGKISLLVNEPGGVVLYSIGGKKNIKQKLKLEYVSTCKVDNDQLFVAVSDEITSSIFQVEVDSLRLIHQQSGFIKSFDINTSHLVVLTESKTNFTLQYIERYSNEKLNFITLKNQKCRQVLFANDSTILYNSNKNGIWNGKMWNIKTAEVQQVTNYRSNIAFHDYSEVAFVEYLDRGENSSLFITEHLETNEFYSYDTIIPAYFFKSNYPSKVVQAPDSIKIADSLESYSFQSPINKNFDFTLSNYDSLVKESVKKKNSNNVEVQALNLFKPAQLVIQLSNKLLVDNVIGYQEALKYHTPDNLNIRMSSMYVNQFNTKSIALAYQGLLQANTHDIAFSFTNLEKFNFKIEMLHRQRNLFDQDRRNRYSVDLLKITHKQSLNNFITYAISPSARFDRNVALSTNEETIEIPNQKKLIALLNIALESKITKQKSIWEAKYNVAPHYLLTNSGWNITSGLKLSLDYKMKTWFRLKVNSEAKTSLGKTPIAFVLGGQNQDVLTSLYTREFSDSKDPMLYNLVYGVRGFEPNYRNGTTYFLANFDLLLKPQYGLIARPLVSELFGNLEIIPFFDIATSFYGKGIYDRSNSLNKTSIASSTGTIKAEVRSFKNPLIGSIGLGTSTQVYSYLVRLDIAYGIEEGSLRKPIYHLRVGYTL